MARDRQANDTRFVKIVGTLPVVVFVVVAVVAVLVVVAAFASVSTDLANRPTGPAGLHRMYPWNRHFRYMNFWHPGHIVMHQNRNG